jgi:uncharacterized protein YraI
MKRTQAILAVSAVLTAIVLSAPALAFTSFSTAHLNIRSGPGPQYPVVAMINYNDRVEVSGCLQDVSWCAVTAGGVAGWAAGEYLAYDAPGAVVQLPTAGDALSIPVVTYQAVDAVVGTPVGAIIGVAAGAPPPLAIVPPPTVLSYVPAQAVAPVIVTGEVVIGAVLPTVVPLYAVPESPYQFTSVNGQNVLVEPSTRRVVYIYR